MLHKIWLAFIVSAFVATCYNVFVTGDLGSFQQVMNAVTSMARTSVDIALGLIGLLAFWLGIFKVAEHSGLISKFSRLLAPFLCRIMPDIPRDHPALGSITMNMSANILGLDNAATPFGIKAMQDMQTLAPIKDTLTNSQILFLVLNTSSVTLFPIAVFLYRAEQGAAEPTDVFIPILLATSASTLAGLFVTCTVQKINLFNKVVLLYLVAIFSFLAAVILYFSTLAAEQLSAQSALIANFALLTFIVAVLVIGWRKGQNTYEQFVDGAKQGFEVAISIIPYLLAMLFAIGMLRASGVLDLVTVQISHLFAFMGFDTRFVDGLPTAIMKPLSGSGARALMIETMQFHGADSFAGRLASVLQGSTETTFYVLAVYLGAVGIKHSRYAVGCCLAADFAGIFAAILVSYWFFG
ncbi:nucleoside recognition domain-containing protein [Glaciecola petra]|uniref:Nucleoside recognition domain-containing protein n=1 Tax=Glaciecola petra TaxID=3075602 RepID=A0ABU2ZPQ7_9ALTE|nr:nucleoside recognition domain-containing protein [Aestuariibacter sp. P117]MDT0594339.1 nucleoside recognition domain-containing protein [Aestuariibacter sp. P117]